jgi:hypothetical protein
MIDPDDDVCPISEEELALAELTEEISRRLESGDPVNGGDLGENQARARGIRQLLPALRTMVTLGEQVAREERSQTQTNKKNKRTSSSSLDTNLEVDEVNS